MWTAILNVNNTRKVIGFYPSHTEAFVNANRAWENWITENLPTKDQDLWIKAGSDFKGFGPEVSEK